MTTAGPMKTYGRTPSRKPSGSQLTTRSIAQNSANTPPTPTTIATSTTRIRLAVLVAQEVEAQTPARRGSIADRVPPTNASDAQRRGVVPGEQGAALVGPLLPLLFGYRCSGQRCPVDYEVGQLSSMVLRAPLRGCRGRPSCTRPSPVQKLPGPDLGRHQVGGVETPGALLERRRSGPPTRRRGCRSRSSPAPTSTFGEMRDDATTPPIAHCTSSPMNWLRKSTTSGRLPFLPTTVSSPPYSVPSLSIGGKREPVVVDAGLRVLPGRTS